MTSEIVKTACPHDCPSACALEVERLSPTKIGRVRGNASLPFTAGVVCEKVGRYAERVHHPDRLTHPMRRVGAKGEGKFERIGWDPALMSTPFIAGIIDVVGIVIYMSVAILLISGLG